MMDDTFKPKYGNRVYLLNYIFQCKKQKLGLVLSGANCKKN